jgi:cytochrome c peroxidase
MHWLCGLLLNFLLLTTACAGLGVDATTEAQALALGRQLFFDPTLSNNQRTSCASCHQAEHAYADQLPRAQGQLQGARNTPSLLNIRWFKSFGWDGGVTDLSQQVLLPFVSPAEHGLTSLNQVLLTVNTSAAYRAFQSEKKWTERDIGHALASYVRSLSPVQSKPFSAQAAQAARATDNKDVGQAGKRLFVGKAGCAVCHRPTEGFTDNKFHPAMPGTMAADKNALSKPLPRYRQLGLEYQRRTDDLERALLGRFWVSLDPADVGKFRTPSLYHLALTAPYGVMGEVASLQEAIRRELKRHNKPLSEKDLSALESYLLTLSDTPKP